MATLAEWLGGLRNKIGIATFGQLRADDPSSYQQAYHPSSPHRS